jgi:hypothetical protein
MNIVYQGRVATDGSTRITCTGTSLLINVIIINNLDGNYVFSLHRFETGPGIHNIPIYQFDLDLGDSIRDTEGYLLSQGDYLELNSDVDGTTFYISGEST